MKVALVLVDVQRDFLQDERLFPTAEMFVEAVATLLAAFRARGLPVVHVRLLVEPDLSDAMPHWSSAERPRCIVGRQGADPPAGLEASDSEIVVRKRAFSGFAGSTLNEVLVEAKVDTLVLAGLYAHSCIRATALDAYQRGFRTTVARQAVASNDPLHEVVTRRYFSLRGIGYLDHAEVIDLLAGNLPTPRESGQDFSSVLDAAQRAQQAWAALPVEVRADRLGQLIPLLESQSDSLADQIVHAVGKPRRFCHAEVARCIAILKAVVAAEDRNLRPRPKPEAECVFQPLGVVAVITPWNHPLAIAIGKIAPALFYGNAVIWKPSPVGAGLAELFLEICLAAGLPEGLLQIVTGDADVGEQVMDSAGIDAVTITGGAAAGHSARAICAARGIRLQAELGGNNAAIVWHDTDRQSAARSVAAGAFGYAGQRCTANRRVIVPHEIAEQFLAELVDATRELRWGAPDDADTDIGPLISAESVARVRRIVERARDGGLRVLAPHGEVPDVAPVDPESHARYYPPSIVFAPPPDHEIVRTETLARCLLCRSRPTGRMRCGFATVSPRAWWRPSSPTTRLGRMPSLDAHRPAFLN